MVALSVQVAEGRIFVSVVDGSPEPAVLKEAGDDDECGRGMVLVDEFAEDWGSEGQETWALFRYVPPSLPLRRPRSRGVPSGRGARWGAVPSSSR